MATKPQVLNPAWYYGAVSRVEAESLLMASNTNSMLLRNSRYALLVYLLMFLSVPGNYALSKYDSAQRKCFHILIDKVSTGYRMQGF